MQMENKHFSTKIMEEIRYSFNNKNGINACFSEQFETIHLVYFNIFIIRTVDNFVVFSYKTLKWNYYHEEK